LIPSNAGSIAIRGKFGPAYLFHAIIAVRSEATQQPEPPSELLDRRSRHGGLGWWRCAPELPARCARAYLLL